MSGDYAIVGDGNDRDAYILKRNTSTNVYEVQAAIEDKVDPEIFGYSAAINGDYAMVGGYLDDESAMDAGAVTLYRRIGSIWTQVEKILGKSAGDFFGRSVDMTPTSYIIGASGHNDNRGKVYYYPIASPTNVVASDGGDDKTDINWDYDGPESPAINGFRIHRNGVLAGSVSASSRSFSDTDGIPGVEYVYSVFAYNSITNFESYLSSDTGFKEAEGKIKGSIISLSGGPVPDVTITATGLALGDFYTYTATSIGNGTYTIDNVFFDPDSTTVYAVNASFPGHLLVPRTLPSSAFLDDNNPTDSAIDFIDKTAFIIKGIVSQKNTSCNLEGITVKATSSFVNDPDLVTTATSIPDGSYSLIVDPMAVGLTAISLTIDEVRSENTGLETTNIYYDFQVLDNAVTTITDFSNFPIETEVNFEDELTYPVTLMVQNACNAAISQDHFEVRVRTLDGCYDQTFFTTETNGEVTVNLPPLNFDMKVVGVDNQTGQNQLALDFFAAVPNKINLFTFHRDTFAGLSIQQRVNLGDLNLTSSFTYHKAPDIQISGFSSFFCNDLVNPAIIQQGSEYSLSIDIQETHNGVSCGVSEGILKITNPAALNSSVILEYDLDLNGFPSYTFIGR